MLGLRNATVKQCIEASVRQGLAETAKTLYVLKRV
jgi:hypothetical protein